MQGRVMRRWDDTDGLMRLSLLLIMLVQAGPTQPSPDELQLWFTYYYLKPRPELLLPSLNVVDRDLRREKRGSLAKEVNRGGLRTFYAKVLAQNDQVVGEVARRLSSLPRGQQAFITEALRRCGTQACLGALRTDSRRPSNRDQPATPEDLDDNWAAFFATGDERYVRAIIELLPWSEEKDDLMRLATGGAARWSLASNAYQHSRVLAICEESAGTSEGARRRILDEIVSRAKAQRAKKPPAEPK